MTQWVDMEAKKSRTERMPCVSTLFEAVLRLLIHRTAPRESNKHKTDA